MARSRVHLGQMSQNPSSAVGQVSADGQFRWDGTQWVPIAAGTREPTSWTRPMQLAAAGVFALEAVLAVALSVLFINHDSMLRVLRAQNTQFPAGTSVDSVVNLAIGFTIGTVVFIAVLELVAAVGSLRGWRWMFWAALILFGFGGLGTFSNLSSFARPDSTPMPTGALAVSEVLSVADLALFVWLLVGVIKFGPWAMKKPGR
jgi:hypothetical protein